MNKITETKFLLTGGAGFIGSHIAEYLVHNNAMMVRVIDNLSTGTMGNIQHIIDSNNFEFIFGDITDIEFCRQVMDGIDIVCHQAALGSVPRSVNDPLGSHNANVNGLLNILVAAKEHNIKRVVYASSSSIYGNDPNQEKFEDQVGEPLSPYALTKQIDEKYANLFQKLYGLECIGLRYFNVFGPRQNMNGPYAAVIPRFIKTMLNGMSPIIYGDGSYTRDFTYINNVVQANIQAMTISLPYFNVFNVACGYKTSIYELFLKIRNIMQSNVEAQFTEFRPGDVPHSTANISRAIQYLDYQPHVSIETGLELTIEYFRTKHQSNQ